MASARVFFVVARVVAVHLLQYTSFFLPETTGKIRAGLAGNVGRRYVASSKHESFFFFELGSGAADCL